MKLLLVFTLSFLIASACFAQETTFYLKKTGKYLDNADSADYIRTVRPVDGDPYLYTVKDIYKNGKTKLEAFSLKDSPPMYFDGEYTEYYETGVKKMHANYKRNNKEGDIAEYFPNGKLFRVIIYPSNGARDNEVMERFSVVANYDSVGTALTQNGNGFYKGYDQDFKYLYEWGNIKNGKKDSTWNGEDHNLKITFTEEYREGELMKGTSLKDGQTFTYSGANIKSPEFDGGDEAFGKFLSKNTSYPNYARRNKIQGKVILTFVVEKSGAISDIKVVRSVNPMLDEEAIKALNKSPKWLPGLMHGVPVRVQYSIPINFALK